MALTIDIQDLDNFPGTTKRITVDQDKIVALGSGGDETFVVSVSTTGYSDNVARTAIPTLYVTDFKAGWCKSSGFVGTNGKFAVSDTANKLKVRLDASTLDYEITLNSDASGVPVAGEVIAEDLQDKIRSIVIDPEGADAGFALSYKNATVEFKNNKFWIISGSIGGHYTGDNRTSVAVSAGDLNDCSAVLGFDLSTTSEDLASISIKEAPVVTDFTANGTTLVVGPGTGITASDCAVVTDGTNKTYFKVSSVAENGGNTEITVGVGDINQDYTSYVSRIQVLREQDPEGTPGSIHTSIDDVVRFGIKSIANQIDFSS